MRGVDGEVLLHSDESDLSFIPNLRHRQYILEQIDECDARRRRRVNKDPEMSPRSKVKTRIDQWREENKKYLKFNSSTLESSLCDDFSGIKGDDATFRTEEISEWSDSLESESVF